MFQKSSLELVIDRCCRSNMDSDKLLSEARARIIWGESPLSVHDFLTSNCVSDTIAGARIKEFILERNAEIRKIGIKNTLVGVVLTGAACITSYLIISNRGSSAFARALGLVLLAGLYGLWKLVNGVVYLVRPQSEHKSIPDIVNSDILD